MTVLQFASAALEMSPYWFLLALVLGKSCFHVATRLSHIACLATWTCNLVHNITSQHLLYWWLQRRHKGLQFSRCHHYGARRLEFSQSVRVLLSALSPILHEQEFLWGLVCRLTSRFVCARLVIPLHLFVIQSHQLIDSVTDYRIIERWPYWLFSRITFAFPRLW